MDSITHTVLGACLGDTIAGKQLGKKAMLIGAIVNNLPDCDMLANFWLSDAQALMSHRGITHSLIFELLATPLLIYFFRKLIKNDPLSYRHWLVLVGHGLFLHVILDSCTTYGTGLFEPFSNTRVSFNTLFILDPFFMLPLLVVAISLLIITSKKHRLRSGLSFVGLGLSTLYLVVTIGIKIHVNSVARDEIKRQGLVAVDYLGIPTPLNNLLWYVVVKEKTRYHLGYYSILDRSSEIVFGTTVAADTLLGPFQENGDVQNLLHFSQGYYAVSDAGNKLLFSDIRFGQLGMPEKRKASFVFNFDLIKTGDREVRVKQSDFETAKAEDLRALWTRVKGI